MRVFIYACRRMVISGHVLEDSSHTTRSVYVSVEYHEVNKYYRHVQLYICEPLATYVIPTKSEDKENYMH